MSILDTLEQINWPAIRHSHRGTCEKFPEWIRALLSDEDKAWSDDPYSMSPFSQIYEYSHHQGDIYPVTSFVISFLAELLQAVPARRKIQLLHLLSSFAWSCQFHWDDGEQNTQLWREVLGDQYESVRKQANDDVKATRAALQKHSHLWQTFLVDASPALRKESISLLQNMGCWNSETAIKVNSLLRNRLSVEPDSQLRDMLTQALVKISEVDTNKTGLP